MRISVLDIAGIKYRIVLTDTYKLTIRFDRQGIMIIRAPKNIKLEELDKFINGHLDWIKNNYLKSQPSKRDYQANEKYLFLGHEYSLKVIESHHEEIIKTDQVIYVYTKSFDKVSSKLDKWKKEQCEIVFNEVLFQMFHKMQKELKNYPLLEMKQYYSRWGCCYPKRNKIILNIALIHTPLVCIEYVICHELTHFIHPNHSPDFHLLLQKYVPNERQIRRLLKQYATNYS